MSEWSDVLSVLGWVCNVLLAAFIAFILNSAYQAKRERRRTGASLYSCLCRWTDERDVFFNYISQAMKGTTSYDDAYGTMLQVGVPSTSVITDVEVLVRIDHPDLIGELDGVKEANKEMISVYIDYACRYGSKEPICSKYHHDEFMRLKEEFDCKADRMKDKVVSEKLKVTWCQAIKDVIFP